MILVGVVGFGLDAQIPILLAAIITTIIAFINGITWNEIEKNIYKSLSSVLQALIVLLIIGIMLGTWLQSGIVPAMIYYGGLVISPKFFLPTACFAMRRLLIEKAGIQAHEAGMLMSLVGELRICQAVNPMKTCRMELPLDILNKL